MDFWKLDVEEFKVLKQIGHMRVSAYHLNCFKQLSKINTFSKQILFFVGKLCLLFLATILNQIG